MRRSTARSAIEDSGLSQQRAHPDGTTQRPAGRGIHGAPWIPPRRAQAEALSRPGPDSSLDPLRNASN